MLKNKSYKKSIAVFFLTAMLFSCNKETDSLHTSTNLKKDFPLSVTHDFILTYTLQGHKVLTLSAPVMEDYSNKKKFQYQYFPKTFKVILTSEKNNDSTIVTADKAYIYKNPDLTELIGHVTIRNTKGGSLKTNVLYWDAQNNHIFGEEETTLQQNGESIKGIGFDSSLDFKNVRINKMSGKIKIQEKK
jgi:LPS export ABC transporter protein LptC